MDRVSITHPEDLAASQHGLITRRQLVELNVSPGVISRRLQSGTLVRVDTGVYRLRGSVESQEQQLMAAVLVVGPDAAVSHQSAAHLWGLLERAPDRPHVSVVRGRWRNKPFHVHRSTDLGSDHVGLARGIPTTVPARTVLDLGATASPRTVAAAFGTALRDGHATLEEMESMLLDLGRQGRAGIGAARRLIEERRRWLSTHESVLEDEFRRIVEDASLPRPSAQCEIRDDRGAFLGRVDFAYPERRLVIEIDGYLYHSDPASFVRDRIRQNRLLLAGYKILRYTAKDLHEEQTRVAAEIARSLA